MKAAVYHRYGPPEVVRIEEVPRPVPGPNEVLVRVHATTVCAADWRLRKADPFIARFFTGLTRPGKIPILGMEYSGVVEEVGRSVTRFKPGDAVFGSTLLRMGAHAEYLCAPEDGPIAGKPVNMDFQQAAAVMFGALTAWAFLRRAEIQPGQKVLIYGASGSVGVFAVQIARRLGAEVTGVCSTRNLETVRSLGADAVIDYTREDFASAGPVYDVIFETVGKSSFRRGLKALKRGGIYLTCAPMPLLFVPLLGGFLGRRAGARKVTMAPAKGSPRESAASIKALVESGAIRTVIDKVFPFEDIVEAHRLAEGGHKRGHAVVAIR